MKLDRNVNPKGYGKYALCNMRKLIPVLDAAASSTKVTPITKADIIKSAFDVLCEEGIISIGNETPGDQFFVMKYKDKFTWRALDAYATEAEIAADHTDASLIEYAKQMRAEARAAEKLGNRIPD